MSTLSVAHLGPTTYRDGLALQEALVRARAEGRTGDWLLYPDHPPVLTVGRSGRDESLKADPETLRKLGIEIFEVARGGDFTWHGPGQLVGYVIADHRARTGPASLPARPGIEPDCGAGRVGLKERPRRAGPGLGPRREDRFHRGGCPALGQLPWIRAQRGPGLEVLRSHPSLRLRGIHMTSVASRLGAQAPGLDRAREVVARHLSQRLGHAAVRWATPEDARREAMPGAAEAEPIRAAS
jgi:hypothetical protein